MPAYTADLLLENRVWEGLVDIERVEIPGKRVTPRPATPRPATPRPTEPRPTEPRPTEPQQPDHPQPADRAQQIRKDQADQKNQKKSDKLQKQEIRKLVLVPKEKQDTLSFQTAIAIRNSINSKLGKVVVSTVTLSSNRNVVLGTMPAYTADLLLENRVWEGLVDVKRVEIPEKWVRIVAHGVPIGSIETLKKEIIAFNSYSLRGDPRWLTTTRRPDQGTASIVIQLPREEKGLALKNGLVIAGSRLRTESWRPKKTPP